MKKMLALMKLTFLEKLAYIKAIWFDILGTLVSVFIYYFLWKIIFLTRDTMEGFNMAEITTYVIFSKILSAQFSGGINELFSTWIYDGMIGVELLRPMSLFSTLFSRRMGEFFFFLVFKASPIIIVLFVFLDAKIFVDALCLLLFAVCVLVSIGVMFCIEMIVGMLSFYTLNCYGLAFTKKALLSLLSGGIVPLFVFPDEIAKVLEFLPFAGMVSVPINIYLGKYDYVMAIYMIGIQCIWLIAFYIFAHILFQHVIKKVVVQGG